MRKILCLSLFFVVVYSRISWLRDKLGKDLDALRLVSIAKNVPMDEVKVLCWVNTYDKNHKERVNAIKRTWGKKCDKLLFFSNVEDDTYPTVRVIAPATHEALWLKHKAVLRILYREYYGQYDWFYKCDDDTFLFMENLKQYLLSDEIARQDKHKPLLLGHRMTLQWWEMQRPLEPLHEHDARHVHAMKEVKRKNRQGLLYTPGGGGYVLNWAYIKLLTESLDEPECLPNVEVPDDWAISFCMFFKNIIPYDTRDAYKRERFHQYSPQQVYHQPHDDQDYNREVYPSIYYENNWFSDHNGLGWKNGSECCAESTISFHYIKGKMMDYFSYYFYQGGKELDFQNV